MKTLVAFLVSSLVWFCVCARIAFSSHRHYGIPLNTTNEISAAYFVAGLALVLVALFARMVAR